MFEECRVVGAVFLVKDVLDLMGWRERARVFEEAVLQRVRVDLEYLVSLVD